MYTHSTCIRVHRQEDRNDAKRSASSEPRLSSRSSGYQMYSAIETLLQLAICRQFKRSPISRSDHDSCGDSGTNKRNQKGPGSTAINRPFALSRNKCPSSSITFRQLSIVDLIMDSDNGFGPSPKRPYLAKLSALVMPSTNASPRRSQHRMAIQRGRVHHISESRKSIAFHWLPKQWDLMDLFLLLHHLEHSFYFQPA